MDYSAPHPSRNFNILADCCFGYLKHLLRFGLRPILAAKYSSFSSEVLAANTIWFCLFAPQWHNLGNHVHICRLTKIAASTKARSLFSPDAGIAQTLPYYVVKFNCTVKLHSHPRDTLFTPNINISLLTAWSMDSWMSPTVEGWITWWKTSASFLTPLPIIVSKVAMRGRSDGGAVTCISRSWQSTSWRHLYRWCVFGMSMLWHNQWSHLHSPQGMAPTRHTLTRPGGSYGKFDQG